jgi:uncharacterized protein (UPF0335 family)
MVERVEVSVGKLEVQVDRLEVDMAELKGDVKAIRKTLDSVGGGWRTLLMVAGFAAAVGGFVTKMMTVWPFK